MVLWLLSVSIKYILRYLLDIYNIGASLAGLPAISVNLLKKYIGIHIIGHPFEESLILRKLKSPIQIL